MENLIKYCSRLVARHNCVILPGMGAFLAHNVAAYYNAADGVFMPPHRTLGFNPQIKVDDALLQSEYMSDGKLSCEEASAAMARDIAAVCGQLSKGNVLRFGELGTFSMNIKGEVTFQPCENGIDDPQNFGFEPLVLPLLEKCEEKVIVIPRRSFSRYIAVAAAIILAFFVVTPMSDSAYKPSMQAGFAPTKVTEHRTAKVETDAECIIAPVADTATENIITEENTTTEPAGIATAVEEKSVVEMPAVQEAVTPEAAVTEQAAVEQVSEKRFHIIVASSPNASNAELAIKELTLKMEAEYNVVQCGKRHRISIGSYSTNKEACDALTQIKAIFPDAWILTL